MSNENTDKVLKLLNDSGLDLFDHKEFVLIMLESIGCLVLMHHWMRGIVDALIRENNIILNEKQKANWERVIGSLDLYESIVWEMAPARAMITQLRNYRQTRTLEDKYELLTKSDSHGRVVYGLTDEEMDDIADIIRRIADARQTTGIPTFGHANNLGVDAA